MSIDDATTDIPYRLGRLFAVYEAIQFYALGRVPAADIRDRYFTAACTRPALTFASLAKLSTKHFRRLRQNRPGLAVHFNRVVGELLSAVPPTIPGLFTAEQQARFYVGYYHERHRPQATSPAADADNPETQTPSKDTDQ